MATTSNLLMFFAVTFGGMAAVIAAGIAIFKKVHERHVRVETFKEQVAQNPLGNTKTSNH